jgi:hypothetical protein
VLARPHRLGHRIVSSIRHRRHRAALCNGACHIQEPLIGSRAAAIQLDPDGSWSIMENGEARLGLLRLAFLPMNAASSRLSMRLRGLKAEAPRY